MASGTANPDYHSVLVASTVDTVTINPGWGVAYKLISDGTGRIDFTIDGSTPVVGGSATGRALAAGTGGPVSEEFDVNYNLGTTLKLISAATPHYDVENVDREDTPG